MIALSNGPIIVEGPAVIKNESGIELKSFGAKQKVALCRCGQSKNKPFCDGSHQLEFQAFSYEVVDAANDSK